LHLPQQLRVQNQKEFLKKLLQNPIRDLALIRDLTVQLKPAAILQLKLRLKRHMTVIEAVTKTSIEMETEKPVNL
jgi:hypothetical protein